MYDRRFQVLLVLLTMVGFLAMLILNELLFDRLEFTRGVNWVYLPAGMRLLCTLLFGGAGAIGLLLASWLVCFLYFFPDDYLRAFVGGILPAVAPYLVYRLAQRAYGLHTSLANLSPRRLLICAGGYAIASPLLHHVWFYLQGQTGLLNSFFAMVVGDLTGSLIVLYLIKGAIGLKDRVERSRAR